MIIVFLFIVLKYFSFCCHSSHSILFWNPLVYSCFVLFVKSDSKLNQNSSCYFFILFNLFVTHLCLYPVFHFSNLTFLISDCFFMYSVFPVTLFFLSLCLYVILSFLLFCLYVILSFLLFCLFYYFVFMLFCLFSSFCRTFSPPFFPLILASFLPFHLFIF